MKIIIKKENIFYIILSLILIMIAGLRVFGWANDTSNYFNLFVDQDVAFTAMKELSFRLIIFISNVVFSRSFTSFLLIYAILGISLKIFVFSKYSPMPTLSIILYLLSYFWLHEYIQIRAGVATGIFMLSINDLTDKNSKKYFIKTFLAIMFHWSSIIMVPIYFLVKHKNLRHFAILPILGIILNILNINLYFLIEFLLNSTGIDDRFYTMYAGYQNEINVFNLISISYLLLFYTITLVIFTRKNRITDYEIVLYKIFSLGIFIFFLVSVLNAPVVAFRLLEYFMVVLLVLIPCIVIKFKERLFVSVLAIAYYSLYCYYLFANVIEFEKAL
ncbi:EpsG family protein [uncultured Draconibacterium sp.]|uniref:EpsG family protein n=1 Tax=uncultured Draconibacterium sp. TaxID=1573823 RepID=UPI002AA7905E|nr:EpsG family protein [uncultured Draconibacterium sp.]